MRTWWVAPLYPIETLSWYATLLHVFVSLSNSYWPQLLSSLYCQHHLSYAHRHAEVFQIHYIYRGTRDIKSSIIYSVIFSVIDDHLAYLIQLSAVSSCQTFATTGLILLKLNNLWKLIGVKCVFSPSICLKRGCPGNMSVGRDVINSLIWPKPFIYHFSILSHFPLTRTWMPTHDRRHRTSQGSGICYNSQ